MDWDGENPSNPSDLEGTQGLCPSGWHVPTDNDWKTLEGTVDSDYGVGDSEWDGTGHRGLDAGSQLAGEASLWGPGPLKDHINFGNSNFDVFPAGHCLNNGVFEVLGDNAFFWSSSGAVDYSIFRSIFSSASSVDRNWWDQFRGFSVRCLKD